MPKAELFGDGTEPPGGNADVSRKTSIAVVAGHELLPADRRLASSARTTVAAGDHSRNDYVAALPTAWHPRPLPRRDPRFRVRE